jgi:hypothetical protein
MPRIDDYRQAKELAKNELSELEPDFIAKCTGAAFHNNSIDERYMSLPFLNRIIKIEWPSFNIIYKDSGEEVPIQQQVLILHYLNGAASSEGVKITGDWISFQDINDGRFYMGAFIKRAKDPLLKIFGDNPKRLVEISSEAYEASLTDFGDFSVILKPLPLVPMVLVLWEGDEDFPPEGNILFDKSISKILSAEDVAWLAGMVIYPLIGIAKS